MVQDEISFDRNAIDLSEDNKRIIREEYLGASNFCDGDIFRHLRRCRLSNNPGEKTWLARLSESKRSDILQLEKAADKDRQMRKFRDSLDALLPFAGLWRALHIGAFHRLLPLHCPEVDTSHLQCNSVLMNLLGADVLSDQGQSNVGVHLRQQSIHTISA